MKKFFAVLAGLVVALFVAAPVAHADVNDFVIERFAADYTLANDDRQGTLRVTEKIDVHFNDQNHGILRAIPDHYKNHRLQMQVGDIKLDGQPAEWTSYTSNGNTVLKIGDPDKTITGYHRYEIDYTVRNVISFYSGHDELYWDVNGDQWQQTAKDVSVVVRLPDGLRLSSQQPICYVGSFGSTRQDCQIEVAGKVISARANRSLGGYENLSIVAGFEKGFFQPSAWHETAGEYAAAALKFLTPFLVIGGTAFVYWWRNGRDPRGRRIIVPEYEAPDGLKPIEAGTVADFRTDNRDITATIIDLAIRGYITIIETVHERKLRTDTKTYTLRLEKDNLHGLKDFEVRILRGIFEKPFLTGHPVGAEVDLSTLKFKLASVSTEIRRELKTDLTQRGYFRKTRLSTTLRFAGLLGAEFLLAVVMAVVLQGSAVIVGIIAGTVVAVISIILLPSRTPKGVAAKESILGLKLYMKVAEKQRIQKLQGPNAPYAHFSAAEPKKTVHLFEKLLPYAMALGVEEQWAKQFEDVYRTPPDWYQGNWRGFSAVYLAGSLNSGVQSSVNAAFSSPSSSGGSGFSGGGSGGGGGGGGGGGW